MSQQPQIVNEPLEYLPFEERRAPAPITNLPVNALTGELDPTREIRTLIEQLQQGTREARSQARQFEHERNDLAVQLEGALTQIDQLRAKEREWRAQFVEITSLIRERDAAKQETEVQRKAAAGAQRQLEALARERSDAQRQKEELSKKHADAAKLAQEAHTKLAEALKQIVSIRQARDAANAQNMELTGRFARLEDELADLGYQRDLAQKTQLCGREELSNLRRQLSNVIADRDATAVQVQELQQQLDAARKKLLDLADQNSAATRVDAQATAALDEARRQVLELTSERDMARNRAQDHAREADVFQSEVQKLREELAASVPVATLEDAQRQLATLTSQGERQSARERELRDAVAHGEQSSGEMAGRLSAAERGLADAQAATSSAEGRIDELTRDCDASRAQRAIETQEAEIERTRLLEQMAEQQVRLETANQRIEELSSQEQEKRVLAARFEKQRIATIDLGARLEATQREVLELSAKLAEARLTSRHVPGRSPRDTTSVRTLDLEVPDGEGAPPLPEIAESFDQKSAKSSLAAMRRCLLEYQKDSSDISLLNELYCHVYSFSERARVSGYVALHRVCGAFAHFAQGLYEVPETVNESTLRTVGQTIEFLTALLREKNIVQIKDPAKAHIYVVEDDFDNAEAIKLAMDTALLRTTCVLDPSGALADLEADCFDLIVLDVNLPGMDGFELCEHIRQFPAHAHTPIIFLTGMVTPEYRIQSEISGANDFVCKPFNLHELTVKTLTLILKASLR